MPIPSAASAAAAAAVALLAFAPPLPGGPPGASAFQARRPATAASWRSSAASGPPPSVVGLPTLRYRDGDGPPSSVGSGDGADPAVAADAPSVAAEAGPNGAAGREGAGEGSRPSLFKEAERMILASFCGYPITQLRREAKAGALKDSDKVLDLLGQEQGRHLGRALAVADLVDVVEDNWDYLADKYCEHVEFSSVDAFRRINNRADSAGDRMSITLEEFDDADEGRRLVYGLAIDRNERRITLIFRGTYPEGTEDWKRNFQFDMRRCPTPLLLLGEGDQGESGGGGGAKGAAPRHVCVHRGFYEYMFENQERDPNFPNERFDEIMEFLKPLFKEYPGYQFYVTGHSLGGALGTLTAFYLASSTDPDIPKPINLVTCGSPLVGDENFRAAHQVLERRGWIRHLRVTNDNDCIPKGWPFSVVDRKLYKHVGVHLELFDDEARPCQLEYRQIWPGQRVPNDGLHFPKFNLDLAKAHGVSEYMRRILLCESKLEGVLLDDYYRDL